MNFYELTKDIGVIGAPRGVHNADDYEISGMIAVWPVLQP